MKKKKKQKPASFTVHDYIKAVKRADREIALQNATGFKAVTKVHKSKKEYNRKESKKIDFDTLFFVV